MNIISEHDIVKNEQELLQRIVLTSNIQKPVEKVLPKVLEVKPPQTETSANAIKPERIIIPPPKKRTGLRKRLKVSLGKREVPNSDQDTRATNSAQKGQSEQQIDASNAQKRLKLEFKGSGVNSTPISPQTKLVRMLDSDTKNLEPEQRKI